MLTSLLILLASTTFPAATETAWMEPSAFHLEIGMRRARAVAQLKSDGWTTSPGKEPNHLVVQYDEGKTITLTFRKERLESARFEYVGFIPAVKKAFAEQESLLAGRRGKPTKRVNKPVLLTWDDRSPNITLVLSTARDTSFGQQGLGFLVVRYFIPRF